RIPHRRREFNLRRAGRLSAGVCLEMVHRRLIPLLLLAALALALPASDAVGARRQVPQGFLGANVSGPMLDPGVGASGEFAVMTRAGVESVRLPLFWASMQPAQDGPIGF